MANEHDKRLRAADGGLAQWDVTVLHIATVDEQKRLAAQDVQQRIFPAN